MFGSLPQQIQFTEIRLVNRFSCKLLNIIIVQIHFVIRNNQITIKTNEL